MQYLYKAFKLVIIGFVCLFVFPIVLEVALAIGAKAISPKCPVGTFYGESDIAQAIKREKQKLCALGALSLEHNNLDLAKVTQFDWDTVYFSMPYQPKFSLVSKIGFEADVLACSKSGLADEWTQMIFEYKGDVVMFFDISSHLFDYHAMREVATKGLLKDNSKILFHCN